MTLTATAAFAMGLTYPTLVVLAYGALRSGPAGYGFLEAVIGAGAVLGALTVPGFMREYHAGRLILTGVIGVGATYALAGLLQNFALALLFLFCCGVANNLYLVPILSVTQREAPDFIRGRVMSSRFLLAQVGLLSGMALAGPLTERLGAPLVFGTAGFLLIAAGLVGFGFRNLRNATLREESSRPVLEVASG
jgi:MFS family permease